MARNDPILNAARSAADRQAQPEPPARPFIHLRVHSAYSLLEGALKFDKIVGHAVKDLTPAIAITDTNNLFGALEFAQKAVKDGVQPIVGCQLDTLFSDAAEEPGRGHRKAGPDEQPLVLIAATEDGYANIVRLVSRAYLDNAPGEAIHIRAEWLR
jgi:DNA polymerase III subunit alpha